MEKTMKALVYQEPGKYGLMDMPVPVIKEPTDVIGRVTLAAICTSDLHQVRGESQLAPYPRIQGHEFCCEVVEVGSAVKNFKPGDRCVVMPGTWCFECSMCKVGLPALCPSGGVFGGPGPNEGCHAEYVRIPWADQFMIHIPDDLAEEDVILLPDMLGTAWFGITNAEVKEGQTAAVIGVGPVGQCTCLLAKKVFGARQVIAVDTNQERLDLALKAGTADFTINPTTDDVGKRFAQLTGDLGVDAVIETAGIRKTFNMAISCVRPNGIVSTVAMAAGSFEVNMPKVMGKNLTIRAGIQKCDGVPEMMQMIREGRIDTKFMLTHKAPLNDIEKGYDIFGNQKDGCMKWLITPYER